MNLVVAIFTFLAMASAAEGDIDLQCKKMKSSLNYFCSDTSSEPRYLPMQVFFEGERDWNQSRVEMEGLKEVNYRCVVKLGGAIEGKIIGSKFFRLDKRYHRVYTALCKY